MLLLGLAPIPGTILVGILVAIPGILILGKTIPHLNRLRHKGKAILALGIALLPTTALTIRIVLELGYGIAVSLPGPAADSYSTTAFILILFVLPSSLISLYLFKSLLKHLSPLNPVAEGATQHADSKTATIQDTTVSLKKTLKIMLIAALAAPFIAGAVTAIIQQLK